MAIRNLRRQPGFAIVAIVGMRQRRKPPDRESGRSSTRDCDAAFDWRQSQANFRSLLVGFTICILTSVAVSRLIQSFLYGVSEFDPVAYGSTCLVLLGAAAAASWLPARRAVRIEPIQALRHN